jgi:hypothetical protein
MKSVRYFSMILTKTEMEQLFLKFSNIEFHENRFAVLSLLHAYRRRRDALTRTPQGYADPYSV